MKRVLGVASICVWTCVACGGDPDTEPGDDAGAVQSDHPHSGFVLFSAPPSLDAGTWDFAAMPDNSAGQTCDPADPEACVQGLMCCRSGGANKCVVPIRIGHCPLEPSGPSGGRSSQSGPWRAPNAS